MSANQKKIGITFNLSIALQMADWAENQQSSDQTRSQIIDNLFLNRQKDIANLLEGQVLVPRFSDVTLDDIIRVPMLAVSSPQRSVVDVEYIAGRNLPRFTTDKEWLLDSLLCVLTQATNKKATKEHVKLRIITTRVSRVEATDGEKEKNFPSVFGIESHLASASSSRSSSPSMRLLHRGNYDVTEVNEARLLAPEPSIEHMEQLVKAHSRTGSLSRHASPAASSPSSPTDLTFPARDGNGRSSPCASRGLRSVASFKGSYSSVDVIDYESTYSSLPSETLVFEIDVGEEGESLSAMQELFLEKANWEHQGEFVVMKHRTAALGGSCGVYPRRGPGGAGGCLVWLAVPYQAASVCATTAAAWASESPNLLRSAYSTGLPAPPSKTTSDDEIMGINPHALLGSGDLRAAAHNSSPTSHCSSPLSVDSGSSVSGHRLFGAAGGGVSTGLISAQDALAVAISNLRVLVVDDAPSVTKLVSLHLKKRGVDVVCVVNGQEAVDIVQGSLQRANSDLCERSAPTTAEQPANVGCDSDQQKFDVILMDQQMPVMDGCEATDRIRVLESDPTRNPVKYRHIIFGMSGNSIDVFKGHDIDDFLPKPFGFPVFSTKYGNILTKQGRSALKASN